MNKWFNLNKLSIVSKGLLATALVGSSLISVPAYALSKTTSANINGPAGTKQNLQVNAPEGASTPITGSPNGICQGTLPYEYCWYYAGAEENYIDSQGASVSITQADPTVSTTDYHSLAEIALKSQDGQQIVEFGWTVAPSQFGGNTYPLMFVYHWVNGEPTCYNGCGYVSVASNNPVGNPVTTGQLGNYEIKYSRASQEWQYIYNGKLIGYFPESLWGGDFTQAFTVEIYGEVSAPGGVPPTSQMGNGILATQTGAAEATDYKLIDGKVKPKLYPFLYGNPQSYEIANVTKKSFTFGGPGGY